MSKHAAFYVAIFATTALFIGYAYAGYRGNAAELATRLRQIPVLRNNRDRFFARLVRLAVLSAAVIYLLAKKHHG